MQGVPAEIQTDHVVVRGGAYRTRLGPRATVDNVVIVTATHDVAWVDSTKRFQSQTQFKLYKR